VRHPAIGIRAASLLVVVSIRLRARGLHSTAGWLDSRPMATPQGSAPGPPAGPVALARELADIVRIAAVLVPDAACLRRALVLRHLLRRKGIAAVMHIGAKPDPAGPTFHAWVEVEGEIVSEPAQRVEAYVPLDLTHSGWPFSSRRSGPR